MNSLPGQGLKPSPLQSAKLARESLPSYQKVSRLSYPHFTKQLLRGRRPFRFVVQAVLLVAVIAFVPDLAFFLIFWGYALNGPARHLLARGLRRAAAPTHHPSVE